MANQILLDYAGTPRHRWHQVWRSPGTPRMCPEIILDRYTETGPQGRTIKDGAAIEELPTFDEWRELFPAEHPDTGQPDSSAAAPPTQFQRPRAILSAGYAPTRVRVTAIPSIHAGAWASPAEYEDWAAEQRKLRGAIIALGVPFYVREQCDGTVLQALANIEPVLLDDQATRIDLDLWWDRIEMYAPGHGILAYREFIDAINDARPSVDR